MQLLHFSQSFKIYSNTWSKSITLTEFLLLYTNCNLFAIFTILWNVFKYIEVIYYFEPPAITKKIYVSSNSQKIMNFLRYLLTILNFFRCINFAASMPFSQFSKNDVSALFWSLPLFCTHWKILKLPFLF